MGVCFSYSPLGSLRGTRLHFLESLLFRIHLDQFRQHPTCASASASSIRRSAVQTRLATIASRQPAHSVAEPRASSKNLARAGPLSLPVPFRVLNSEDRLAVKWSQTSATRPLLIFQLLK